MKVLVLSTDFPYKSKEGTITQGGGGACIAQLVEALLAKKVAVTVVTRAEENIESEIYDTRIVRTKYIYLGFRESKITHSLFLLPRAIDILRKEKLEVIHSHNPPAALVGVICSKLFGKPHVLTMHGPWSGVRQNTVMHFFAELIEGIAVKSVDIVTCDSKALYNELTNKYGLRNSVCIPNAVDIREFKEIDKAQARERLNIRTGNRIMLFTGRFVAEKGLEYLLEAATKILARYDNVTFLLIGGGFDEAIVKNWLGRNSQYKDKILVIPYLKHELMNWAYGASDVFVLPSLAEGLSRSIMEAMACGLPIIATRTGGNPELVNEKTGILVRIKDSEDIAMAIRKLLENEKLSKELGKNAKEFAIQNLTVEKRTQSFLEVYGSLVK